MILLTLAAAINFCHFKTGIYLERLLTEELIIKIYVSRLGPPDYAIVW